MAFRGATSVIARTGYHFSGDGMEKALVFYAAALKAFTSFYDHPISNSPSAPGTEPFNV
jgi:hypothetical protein